ncbi:LIM/homeobox protein Lhx5 isoform X1 [Hydra vulgaris]|uniref:LIM/homeobox protein Lhx5 isoform X1 n=1 Tax=Hydra vulgaris TaxID=6087 RepID=UPI001F5F8012|nr:LIM/homeobox protein Lhx5 isoform X1 [Hydra vulgaris]
MEKEHSSSKGDFNLNNVCSKCSLPMNDKFVAKILDMIMHEDCIRCFSCNCMLKDTCYFRESKFFCKDHFFRFYGVKCVACKKRIDPLNMVHKYKENLIHVACLRCCFCNREATTGEEIHITENFTFVCKEDFEKYQNCQGSEIRNFISDESLEKSSNASVEPSDNEDEINKSRGPRTVINLKQLEVLKETFKVNQKPSRLEREKLATKTGLTTRVIQVWFQNKRSKERRFRRQSLYENRLKVAMCYEFFKAESRNKATSTQEFNQPTLTCINDNSVLNTEFLLF